MANYLTTDTDLTALADAIRTKGGTSEQLEFPQGFVDAVGAIETGGGGVTVNPLSVTENGTYTAPSGTAYSPVTVDVSASGGYTADDFGDPTKPVGAVTVSAAIVENNSSKYNNLLSHRSGITEVSLPNAKYVPDNFLSNSSVTAIHAPQAVAIGATTIQQCQSLQYLVFPKVSRIYSSALSANSNLLGVDFGGEVGSGDGFIRTGGFDQDGKFVTLVLRSSVVWPLSSISNFNRTPFASNGAGGTLYVPSALIASYQAATNWSTILGYPNNQIKAIEGSIYETQYVDGTPIA